MRLYIAGPMRGLPDFNFPAFDRARDAIAAMGHEPVSPADHDREVLWERHRRRPEEMDGYATGDLARYNADARVSFEELLGWDLKQIIDADGIALLDGWERSTGAGHEVYVARATGKRVFFVHETPAGIILRPERLEIVGLTGYARAGKDTAAEGLVDAGYVRCALADPMRDLLAAMDPVVTAGEGGGPAMTIRLTEAMAHLDRALERPATYEDLKASAWGPEYRRLMQRLGTEGGRSVFYPDFWVERLMDRIARHADLFGAYRFVVPDVRFDNEAAAIVAAGGIVLRIERPGTGPANDHPSERGVANEYLEGVVRNVGSPGSLQEATRYLVQRVLDARAEV